jgi:6-pyruvoyltetrahydropterin/6-carboxytetrahydropterin synthase
MEKWSISVDKEYLKFSVAHFLIFPDGSQERLHGHNYRVYLDLEAQLDEHGLVLDFIQVKPMIQQICEALDEHWIIPGEHPELRWKERADGVMEVRYRESYYAAPKGDCLVLPINNTSAENLSTWIGRQLLEQLQAAYPNMVVRAMRLAVEESPGQRGAYHYIADEAN